MPLLTKSCILPNFRYNSTLMKQYSKEQSFCIDVKDYKSLSLFTNEFIQLSIVLYRPPGVLWFDWKDTNQLYNVSMTNYNFLIESRDNGNYRDYHLFPRINLEEAIYDSTPVIAVPL